MIDTQSKAKGQQIGHRIEFQNKFGTIRYIGEVDGYKGEWLGIDWDDPTRGKHNGTVNGKHYFTASHKLSGSFLRSEKVTPGICIIQSITSRYGHKGDEATINLYQQQFATLEHLWNAPFLKVIGFEDIALKQSNYSNLKVLNSRWQNVNSLGEPQQFSALLPNIVDLDISKNLLSSWQEILQLASDLQHLQVLNISENILVKPSDYIQIAIPHLKTLICGSMQLIWTDMEMISHVFPNIQHIYAPNNKISEISIRPGSWQRLETLDIEDNLISHWDEILKLQHLPELTDLKIGNLKLDHIIINDANCFGKLEKLLIKHNLIEDFASISQLNKLPKLISLGILSNPIYQKDTPANVDQIIIAMIGNLQFLNGNDITTERKGAEIDYTKKFGLEWLNCKNDAQKRNQFCQVHRRYVDLINLYGELEESALKVQTSKTIKESLLEVSLVFGGKVIKKKVPPTLQVQKLVILCQRLFQLSNTPTLKYISQERHNIEYEFDEMNDLSFYSIQTGDKIIVTN